MRLLKQFAVGYLIGVALVAVVFLLTSAAHCAVGKKQSNSLGVPMFQDNPNTYLYASVLGGSYVRSQQDKLGTVVRFQPAHTYSLYTSDILFCGEIGERFNVRGPVVVTYKTQAKEAIDGIGCHTLVSIDEVKEKPLP